MKRTSLDRFKSTQPIAEVSQIDPWELRYSDGGEPDVVYRVADLAGCPTISRALLGAFFEEAGGLRPTTRGDIFCNVQRFVEFIIVEDLPDTIDTLNESLLSRYRAHLQERDADSNRSRWKNKKLSRTTQRQMYRRIERLVITAARLHGRNVHAANNPFPGAANSAKPKPHLSPIALIRILAAAKREVRKTWEDFQSAKTLDASSPLGIAVNLAINKYGSVWPKMTPAEGWAIRRISINAGGVSEIGRRLHSTPETVIPFIILLAYETVANAWALLDISAECVSQDPFFDTRSLISWDTKIRSRFTQSVSRDHRGEFSAPVLISKLKALRASLVPHAAPRHRDKLFLVRGQEAGAAPISKSNSRNGMRAFLKRNDIREEDGTPVRFALDMMRPSVLAEVYRRTQDLLVTFRLAGHVDVKTTIRYVIDRVTDEIHDNAIAEVQNKLANVVREFNESSAQAPEEDAKQQRWVGNERDCKDPYNGRGPLAQKGQLCPTWFFPYTHPGLVVPNDVKYVTTVIRQHQQLLAMRDVWSPARFESVCAPVLRIIVEDILPNLDQKIVAEAKSRANTLPPLPVFPDV